MIDYRNEIAKVLLTGIIGAGLAIPTTIFAVGRWSANLESKVNANTTDIDKLKELHKDVKIIQYDTTSLKADMDWVKRFLIKNLP